MKNNDHYGYETLKKIKYIDYLIHETTRMYGPGTAVFSRLVQKDHYLLNIPIKKNDTVNFSPVANHYNPRYFPDPFKFKPERWENDSELDPFAFVGFSAGPRHCIGKQLAYMESKIALVKFVKRYPKFEIPVKELSFSHKFLYEPDEMKTTLWLAKSN